MLNANTERSVDVKRASSLRTLINLLKGAHTMFESTRSFMYRVGELIGIIAGLYTGYLIGRWLFF